MSRIRFLAGPSHYSLNKKIAKDFRRGLTMIGLARKWGFPIKEIEERIRKMMLAGKL